MSKSIWKQNSRDHLDMLSQDSEGHKVVYSPNTSFQKESAKIKKDTNISSHSIAPIN